MKFPTLIFSISTALLLLQGCAHTGAEKKLDADLSAGAPVKGVAQLSDQVVLAIQNEPNLTADQKAKLNELHHSIHDQSAALRQEALKLRSQLITQVFATKYNGEEVSVIKKRIAALEKKRLALLFSTVDRANVILGHQEGHKQQFMQDFFQWEQFQ